MTACNAFVAHGAAHLLTDTAWFDDRQRVHKFASKAVKSDRLYMAVAETSNGCYPYGRTDQSPQAAAARVLDNAASQKEALQALPAAAEAAFNELTRSGQDPSFRLMVALWHLDWREPETYLICCPKFRSSQCRPFTLNRWPNIITPSVPGADPDWSGDVRSEAIRLTKAQRREPWEDGGSPRIGGSAELTTICEHGVTIEQLVRWPDHIGYKIGDKPTLVDRLIALHALPGASLITAFRAASPSARRTRPV